VLGLRGVSLDFGSFARSAGLSILMRSGTPFFLSVPAFILITSLLCAFGARRDRGPLVN